MADDTTDPFDPFDPDPEMDDAEKAEAAAEAGVNAEIAAAAKAEAAAAAAAKEEAAKAEAASAFSASSAEPEADEVGVGDTVLYRRGVPGHEFLPMVVTHTTPSGSIHGIMLTALPAAVGQSRPVRVYTNVVRGDEVGQWRPRR